MIRTSLALSSLALLAGCAADRQHHTSARNDAGMYYSENRSVNNWGTAAPRVVSNQWNDSATTTVGPDGVERNDRTWSSANRNDNDDDNRNNSDTNAGTYSSNAQPNEGTNQNRADTGMRGSDNQHNQHANQGDNIRRDTMRVTPSQGDNRFGQVNANVANTIDGFFAKCATGLNRFEVEAGELAIQKTRNEQVKNFAQTMTNDHKKAQSELDNILRQTNWNVPSQLDNSHTDLLTHLRQLDGQQFDSEYMSAMAAGHAAAVSMFKDKSKTLYNSELRLWTERQVAGLEKHLDMARSINDRVRPR